MPVTFDTFPEDDLFEIHVDGRLTDADFDAVAAPLREFAAARESFRFIEVVKEFDGIDASLIWKGLKLDAELLPKMSHCAIVSDISWIEKLTRPIDAILSADIRCFKLSELEPARRWVRNATKADA